MKIKFCWKCWQPYLRIYILQCIFCKMITLIFIYMAYREIKPAYWNCRSMSGSWFFSRGGPRNNYVWQRRVVGWGRRSIFGRWCNSKFNGISSILFSAGGIHQSWSHLVPCMCSCKKIKKNLTLFMSKYIINIEGTWCMIFKKKCLFY